MEPRFAVWACKSSARETADLANYGLSEMRKDTLLADRPRLRMEVERLAREGAKVYLNPALQEETDHNLLVEADCHE